MLPEEIKRLARSKILLATITRKDLAKMVEDICEMRVKLDVLSGAG